MKLTRLVDFYSCAVRHFVEEPDEARFKIWHTETEFRNTNPKHISDIRAETDLKTITQCKSDGKRRWHKLVSNVCLTTLTYAVIVFTLMCCSGWKIVNVNINYPKESNNKNKII